jgi:hypothetical protein
VWQPQGIDSQKLAGALKWKSQVQQSAQRWGMDYRWVLAVLAQESGGNPSAVSPAGAIGLMQLMPGTAAALGVDPHDPVQNIDGGVRYLSEQLKRYSGDTTRALQAYNAGPGNVDAGNIPDETKKYVPAVKAYYDVFKMGPSLQADGSVLVPLVGGQFVTIQPDGTETPTTTGEVVAGEAAAAVPDDWKQFFTVAFWKQAAVWIVLVLVGLGTVYVAVQSLAKGGETA